MPLLDPAAIPALPHPTPAPSFEQVVAVADDRRTPSPALRALEGAIAAGVGLAALVGLASAFPVVAAGDASPPFASFGPALLRVAVTNPVAVLAASVLLIGVCALFVCRRTLAAGPSRMVVGPPREVRRFLGRDDALEGATTVAAPGPAAVTEGRDLTLPGVILTRPVDEVILLRGWRSRERCEQAFRDCEASGIDVVVELERRPSASPARARLVRRGGRWFAHYTSVPRTGIARLAKHVLEYSATLVLTLALLPLMALIALAIKATSPGPVLFRQMRTGLGGRRIPCFKFRTMVNGAHSAQAGLAARNEMKGSLLFKMDNDPRVTPVGRFLRRTSLDELPQLFNVLRGELSLIGPRLLSIPLERYRAEHRRRLSVRPGVACAWQAWHRGETDFDAWMRSDLDYLDRWSLRRDLRILCRTAWVVLLREGAR